MEGLVIAGICAPYSASNHDPVVSGGGLIISRDGGFQWVKPAGSIFEDNPVFEIRYHPVDSSIIYAASSKGLFVSTDSGVGWHPAAGLPPERTVRSVDISFTEPRYIAAAVEHDGVVLSRDGGLTWRKTRPVADGNLRIRRVLFDPVNPDILYVLDYGSGLFVYYIPKGIWRPCSRGLESSCGLDMTVRDNPGELILGTRGAGVFSLTLQGVRRDPHHPDAESWGKVGLLPGGEVIDAYYGEPGAREILLCDKNSGIYSFGGGDWRLLLPPWTMTREKIYGDERYFGCFTSAGAKGRFLWTGSFVLGRLSYSENGGKEWSSFTPSYPRYAEEVRIEEIAVSDEFPSRAYVAVSTFIHGREVVFPVAGGIAVLPGILSQAGFVVFMLSLCWMLLYRGVMRKGGKGGRYSSGISLVGLFFAGLAVIQIIKEVVLNSGPDYSLGVLRFVPLAMLPAACAGWFFLKQSERKRKGNSGGYDFITGLDTAAVIIDRNNKLITANTIAEDLFGLSGSSDLPIEKTEISSLADTHGSGGGTVIRVRRNGGHVPLAVEVTPLSEGKRPDRFLVKVPFQEYALFRNRDTFDFTEREAEIAAFLLRGSTYDEIADTLCISHATVKTHVHRLYKKTGAKNRIGFVEVLKKGSPSRFSPPARGEPEP
jgi:DNA-binding CsgD family transcriptional regulator